MFTNWVNVRLAKRELDPVQNLYTDLANGFPLYNLLEILSGTSLRPLGKMSKGKMRIQLIANQNIVFKYLSQTVKTVGIGPNDVVDGNQTLILGLIWSIIVFFMAKDLEGAPADGAPKSKKKSSGNELGQFKKKVKSWVLDHVKGIVPDDVPVTDLTKSFADGKAFCAIVHSAAPNEFEYAPSDDPCENFHAAFDAAEEQFGVPQLLDADDPECWDDEQSMITYLGEMMAHVPDRVGPYVAPDEAAPVA